MLKCRFYCYFYGIFMRALMCAAAYTHSTVCAPRLPHQTQPSTDIQHAFDVAFMKSQNKFWLSSCIQQFVHSVAADRFDTFRAWSRRLSRKNDTEKKTRDQFTGIAMNFLCRIASAHRADDHWLNCTLWMKCCDGMTHTDTSWRARTHKQIAAVQSQTDAAITNESKSN